MLAQALVLGQEDVADGVVAGLRQGDLLLGHFLAQERVGDLNQNAGAIAHQRVGADGAAMLEIFQDLDGVFDDLVRGALFQVGDEADAAGVMHAGRIEQAAFGRLAVVVERVGVCQRGYGGGHGVGGFGHDSSPLSPGPPGGVAASSVLDCSVRWYRGRAETPGRIMH